MKLTTRSTITGTMILGNDHYAAIPYDCSKLTSLAVNGVIPAGTIIPANDETAKGVLLSDVHLSDNPNGTIVMHGFVRLDKLPAAPNDNAKAALPLVQFI